MIKRLIIAGCFMCVSALTHAADETVFNDPVAIGTDAEAPSSITAKVSEKVQEVLLNALSLTGIQYKYGGNSPETGFDCSGFVRYVFKQALNLSLPHNARAMSQIGTQVAQSQLKPGDLVFFNTLKTKFSHVGIYIGDSRFIHSPRAGKEVNVVNMKESYWASRYNGAVRVEHLKGSEPESLKNAESIELVINEESPQPTLTMDPAIK